ncbi:MAG: SemiSWEET family transporter [Janthinobacterium lividum]
MSLVNTYMSAIALLGSFVSYMQAYRIVKRKSAEDLSLRGYLISLFTSTNWLIYGIAISDQPLIVSGIIGSIGAGLVVASILKYS